MISRGFREEKTTTEPKYLGDALDGQGNPVTPITSGILRPSSTRQQPAQSQWQGQSQEKLPPLPYLCTAQEGTAQSWVRGWLLCLLHWQVDSSPLSHANAGDAGSVPG